MLNSRTGDRQHRSSLQDVRLMGWDPVEVFPGQHLMAVVNGTPGLNRAFYLKQGVHELHGQWLIDKEISLFSDGEATLLLKDDACVRVAAQNCSLSGFTMRSDDSHANYMLWVSASRTAVDNLSFENTRDRRPGGSPTGLWPVYLDADANFSSVRNCDFMPEATATGLASLTQVYLEDTTSYCVLSGNRMPVDLGAMLLPRHCISMKVGMDNEAGQAALGAGTWRSFSNFADVELR